MIKQHRLILLLVLAAVFLSGCLQKQTENAAADSGAVSPGRKLIIDTDGGADDASAIILAAKCKDVEILGVTVLAGNVDLEQGADNALMTLEMAGLDAPVYKGASENSKGQTIKAKSVFGSDGMGEADLIHPKRRAEDGDAVTFILETVRQYPDEVEIVALGPATNIAKAIEQDPGTMKICRRSKQPDSKQQNYIQCRDFKSEI